MSSDRSPNERRLRLRAILHAQFTVILAVCLLLAAVGAGLVYTTHVEPGTETETRTVAELTVDTGYTHSAEVTEPNSVFETGTVLEDRETYFTQVSPELDVVAETSYEAPAASGVDTTVESTLVIRNVDDEEDDTVYWEDEELLASEEVTDADSGETVASSFTINVSELEENVTSLEEELGSSPGETETYVQTTVQMDGTLADEPLSYERAVQMGIEIGDGGDTYTINEPDERSDSADRTEQVTVERTYGQLRSVGGPVVLLLSVVATGGLVYGRWRGRFALTPAEETYLSYRNDRSEFDEWITQIRLPESVHRRETATAESLEELVDFAIDNNTGVIDDPESGAFYAVTEDFVYTYRPPPKPSDS